MQPPLKRSRFESGHSAEAHDMIGSTDKRGLVLALKQIVTAEKPELLDVIASLENGLLGGETDKRSDLRETQRVYVDQGILNWSPHANRWRVNLARFVAHALNQEPAQTGPSGVGVSGMGGFAHDGMTKSNATENRSMSGHRDSATSFPPPDQMFAQPDVSALMNVPDNNEQGLSEEMWKSKIMSLPRGSGAVVWQGVLARNEKKRTSVVLSALYGNIQSFLPARDSVLSVSHRSVYEEMLKKEIGAVGLLEPTPSDIRLFQEYIAYFQEKKRAGVIRLERGEYQMVYLVPCTVEGVSRAFGLAPTSDALIAIVGKSTPDSN